MSIENCKDGKVKFDGVFEGVMSQYYCPEHGFLFTENSHLNRKHEVCCSECDNFAEVVEVTVEMSDKLKNIFEEEGECFGL